MTTLVRVLSITFCSATLAWSGVAQTPVYSLIGPGSDSHFGEAVCGIGDVDGDSVPDFLIGAYGESTASVAVYSGTSGGLIRAHTGIVPGDRLGHSVCALGDVNQDGVPDYAAGANWGTGLAGVFSAGYVRVYSGIDGSTLGTLYGSTAGEELGYSLANAGDLDGDGADELIAGSFSAGARVYSPRTGLELFHITGPAGQRFGWSVCGIGDFDGDGQSDLAVGATQVGQGGGYVNIYSGATGALLTTVIGGPNRNWYGYALARLDDLNGDGVPEFAVGCPGEIFQASTGRHGVVYVYSGAGGAPYAVFGATSYLEDFLGMSVAGCGDMDGDGHGDLLVGAPYGAELPNLQAPGTAHIYSGLSCSRICSVGSPAAYTGLGTAVSQIGDLNGDGIPEWIAGGGLSGHGEAIVYSGSPLAPSNYCTAKLNSLGCLPTMACSGTPVLSGSNNFHVLATNVVSHRPGFLYWSPEPDSTPVFGGTRCVGGHGAWRTPWINSGGTLGQTDCSGSFDFAFSYAYMVSKGVPAGCTLYAQYFYRDPGFAPPNSVGLTDGLRFTVLPP
jgi:hypothetical protein